MQPHTSATRPLRVLQVSTVDVRGGAEQVARRLSAAYRARGHMSWLAVGQKLGEDPSVVPLPNDVARGAWARYWYGLADRLRSQDTSRVTTTSARLVGAMAEPVRRMSHHLGLEDFDFPGTTRLLDLAGVRPQIMHAHNLHGGYFDLRRLPDFAQRLPVVLTLHDAWLLSGHCAHSIGCERWRTGCGECPDLTIYPAVPRDATAYNWRRKRSILRRCRLHVASPCRWLHGMVEESMLAGSIVEARVIPNGVDLAVFRPGDRLTARAALGIDPRTRLLVTTGIQAVRSSWRDFATVEDAVTRLSQDPGEAPVELLVVGSDGPTVEKGSTTVRFLPFRGEPSAVAQVLQAADVYVHSSRADTFPLAVLEAMACGRPVVASAVGGIPEQVEDGETGFLVRPGDAAGLAHRLEFLLNDERLRVRFGDAGMKRARRYFDFEHQVDAYLDWYGEVLERPRAAVRA